MDDDEYLHRFGTPLKPLEKDEVPAKKPLAIEDQIVKDENGRRRFHGAFTGGFSAGFWNTVGSLEGWTPQDYKSSRGEKALKVQQRPEDFMDSEDLGEFGIAPQGISTREEFAKESTDVAGQRKRKLQQPHLEGPIPGVPVLEQLLRPVRDKIAVRILKSMGWKPGQGVGPRQTRKEKKQTTARNKREQYLLEHYGAEGLKVDQSGGNNPTDDDDDEEEEDDDDDEQITFAPDDYEPIFYKPKDNRFGMSYTGLSRAPVLSKGSGAGAPLQHINLFGQLEEAAKKKNLSIRGQAFGVGAFEEEDDDIYARDDLTRYDFSLADKQPKKKKAQHVQQRHVIEGFGEDKSEATTPTPISIDLPRDYTPRNWLHRKSRFAPMEASRGKDLAAANNYKKVGLGRHDLDPEQRSQLLGEQPQEAEKKKNPFKSSLLERISARNDNFTRGGVITSTGEEEPLAPVEVTAEVKKENAALLEKAATKTKHLPSALRDGTFKPFISDEAKQLRYEQFLGSQLTDDADITKFLSDLQPVNLSLWDREMEKKEFIQAAKIYRPLVGLMNDRFVSESTLTAEQAPTEAKPTAKEERKIVVERTTAMWKPSALLCKRYNIAEPFGGAMQETEPELKPKTKISVFDYLETSINTKANFQTPTIIPKHEEVVAKNELSASSSSSSAKAEEPPPAVVPPVANELPVKKPTFVPKTKLEQAVEDARDKPISEKTDLFKSIFDDSDDDDDDDDDNKGNDDKTSEDKPFVDTEKTLKDVEMALGLPSTSNAAASNVLRNNSPPRGIFAALFKPPEESSTVAPPPKFAPIAGNKLKIEFKSRAERLKNDKELAMADVPVEDLYGPKLPDASAPPVEPAVATEAQIDAKLEQLWQQHVAPKRKAEKWVERKLGNGGTAKDDDTGDSDSSSSSSSNSDCEPKSKKSKTKKAHKSNKSKKSKKRKEKSKKKSRKTDKKKKKKSKH